jgi:hypothetical protein
MSIYTTQRSYNFNSISICNHWLPNIALSYYFHEIDDWLLLKWNIEWIIHVLDKWIVLDEKENIIYGGYVEILFHFSDFQSMNIQSPKCNMGRGEHYAPLLKISN